MVSRLNNEIPVNGHELIIVMFTLGGAVYFERIGTSSVSGFDKYLYQESFVPKTQPWWKLRHKSLSPTGQNHT